MPRIGVEVLTEFIQSLLRASGMNNGPAASVARALVHGEISGRSSHGVERAPFYLELISRGEMAREGEPLVVSNQGACVLWDGCYLPGQYLLDRAVEFGLEQSKQLGLCMIVIRRAQFTGCHESFLLRAAKAGVLAILSGCGPTTRRVAPPGGRSAVLGSNPIGVGIPTGEQPVILDMTLASTSYRVAKQYYDSGERLPHSWLLDHTGSPTDDPAVLFEPPYGTIQALGGAEAGHKGFGLSLMIEALTLALGGYGRADSHAFPSQSLSLLLIHPDFFAGSEAFRHEMDWIVAACRAVDPIAEANGLRMPGDRAQQLRDQHMFGGVDVAQRTWDDIMTWATRLGVDSPTVWM